MLKRRDAFTLVELLIVVAIVSLLTTILLPSLAAVRASARSTKCLSNLHALGVSMSNYHVDHDGRFWPHQPPKQADHPLADYDWWWWGSASNPVDPSVSPFMNYCQNNLEYLWCPELRWGDYIPQGKNVNEPTTTYGYNAFALAPNLVDGRKLSTLTGLAELFVFNDSAMSPTGSVIQNSTFLEPVTGTPVQMPTSHFRHSGRTSALCADGHASSYGPEGWDLDANNLGFVGTENQPHYAPK